MKEMLKKAKGLILTAAVVAGETLLGAPPQPPGKAERLF